MTAILVVEDDDLLRREVAGELRSRGYDVSEASDVPQALAQLEGARFDVLLTDLRMDERDGIDLLGLARTCAADMRTVLMSGFATARDYQTAQDLGVARVLTKPFDIEELLDAVQYAVDSAKGFHGSVHGLSLVDMLQMFHYGRRTIVLHVMADQPSTMELRDGEIIDATYGDQRGAAAVRKILGTRSGAVQTSVPNATSTRSIDVPFQSLLMDALRELDEAQKNPASRAGALEESTPPSEQVDDLADWGALSSAAPPARGPHPARVMRSLARLAPDARALVVYPTDKTQMSVQGADVEAPLWDVVACVLDMASAVAQTGPCQHLEIITDSSAIALVVLADGERVLLLEVPPGNHLGVQRFRSQVMRLMHDLDDSPIKHSEGGIGHGEGR